MVVVLLLTPGEKEMTNYSIIRKIDKIVNDDDIVIFLGERISSVALNVDRDNYIYVNNDSINFAFLLSILKNLDCRIFVFCESDYVVHYFNSFIEVQKYGRRRKIFIFVIRDTSCDTVFNCMIHPQASFFNIGFRSYKVAPYFRSADDCVKLKEFMKSSRESSVFLVDVDSDVFDKYKLDFSNDYSINRKIKGFLKSLNKKE